MQVGFKLAGMISLALSIALFALWGVVNAADRAPSAEPAARNEPGVEPSAETGKEDNLSTGQEMISRRFKRFEDTLYKIAEIQRRTDPERADLLIRAIGKGKEDRISQQMTDLIQLLRENKQLGDAISRQDDLVANLHSILDLLLSEDRQKELKEEQARIKKYLEEINKIIAKEKGTRADTERGAPTDDVAQIQKKIAEQAGQLGKQMSKDDEAKQTRAGQKTGRRQRNEKGDKKPADGKEGSDSSGDDSDKGKEGDDSKGASPGDQDGDKGKKPDADGGKKETDPKGGDKKPGNEKPGEKTPEAGGDKKPNEGSKENGKPGEQESGEQKPADGKSSEGAPSDGQPSEGQPGDGQPSEGSPPEGSPQNQPPQNTPGREELEKAQRDMQRAVEQLKKKQRNAASDAQDDAIANLQKAKEKLEEILKQFREEERERFLALLEARFQRMLAMQLLVHDATVKLDKTSAEERNDRHAARSVVLARQEDEIALEANKAITLLHDEGTAVAFPEAVEQMKDDMRLVVIRLERTETGELTQGIQKEIIDALEEMIDALQKEIEKGKEKKNKQDQQQQGQQGQQDQQLVDQIAELKMLRTLQQRINHRTKRLGRMVDGEQALDDDVVGQLQNLAERQARIQKAAYDMATGRNK